jgi:hypothetical protein
MTTFHHFLSEGSNESAIPRKNRSEIFDDDTSIHHLNDLNDVPNLNILLIVMLVDRRVVRIYYTISIAMIY